jgi:hypothetical protein
LAYKRVSGSFLTRQTEPLHPPPEFLR